MHGLSSGVDQLVRLPAIFIMETRCDGISNRPLYDSDGEEYPDTRLELIGACLTEQADSFAFLEGKSDGTSLFHHAFCI